MASQSGLPIPHPSSDPGQIHSANEKPRERLLGEGNHTKPALTFHPTALQPHCQFRSMFRYQFRGPLGAGKIRKQKQESS